MAEIAIILILLIVLGAGVAGFFAIRDFIREIRSIRKGDNAPTRNDA